MYENFQEKDFNIEKQPLRPTAEKYYCFRKKALYSKGVMKMHEAQKKTKKNRTLRWEIFYQKMSKIVGKIVGKFGRHTHYEV